MAGNVAERAPSIAAVGAGVLLGVGLHVLWSRRTIRAAPVSLQYVTSKMLGEAEASGKPLQPTVKYGREFALTASPQPGWKAGDSQPSPYLTADVERDEKEAVVHLDASTADGLYGLLTSAVAPRPIALVSSQSAKGVGNLAPFSYFNVVCHKPAMVMISVNTNAGAPKDTMANILETKQFVVNLISEWMVEAANHTSGPFPEDQDEMHLAGLTPVASSKVDPPRVRESAFSMECEVRSVHPVYADEADLSSPPPGHDGERKIATYVVLANVLMIHAQRGAMNAEENVMDLSTYRPVSRLGGVCYSGVSSSFVLARPARPKE